MNSNTSPRQHEEEQQQKLGLHSENSNDVNATIDADLDKNIEPRQSQ